MLKLSEIHGVNIEAIDRIVNFQFAELKSALSNNAVVELTGFAKWTINQTKVKNMTLKYLELINRALTELEDQTITEQRRKKLLNDIKKWEDHLAYVRSKVRTPVPGRGPSKEKLRRLAEQKQKEEQEEMI